MFRCLRVRACAFCVRNTCLKTSWKSINAAAAVLQEPDCWSVELQLEALAALASVEAPVAGPFPAEAMGFREADRAILGRRVRRLRLVMRSWRRRCPPNQHRHHLPAAQPQRDPPSLFTGEISLRICFNLSVRFK